MTPPAAHPSPSTTLQATIDALEAQRPLLGDAVVDQALAPLRLQLAALQGTAPAAQRLRQAHILFLDVVGSTTLGDRLDPESLHQLMEGSLQRFSHLVRAHGGEVLQYAGDSLLAVWGGARAHEDDAERAVNAGLALLADARQQAQAVARDFGAPGFAIRVGLHTGPVLLGGGVAGEGSIRGQAVNVAARMEQSAPVFGLRISHDLQRLVRGLFDMTAQPPLAVKGVPLPMVTWLVHGARPVGLQDPRRGIEGLGVALVGRDAERGQLTAAWQALCVQGQPALWWLEGEAGVGKSRLRQEVEHDLALLPLTPQVQGVRCHPQGGLRTWGVLRDLLFHGLGVADDAHVQHARAALTLACSEVALPGQEAPATAAALLGQLLGLPCEDEPAVAALALDSRQLRLRALAVATALLHHRAQQAPQLWVVEDVHWADTPSVGFLTQLATASTGGPLAVWMLARPLPQVVDGRARPEALTTLESAREAAALRLRLQPLDTANAGALADALLAAVLDAPSALRNLLIDRAEGNPFYMEELLQMLIDRGHLVPLEAARPAGPRWRLAHAAAAVMAVPPTLVGVLQARLDMLPAAEREALLRASVVGALFWADALADLQPGAPAELPALSQRELALPRGNSSLLNADEWAFRHHLLHQVTYDNVLRAEKQAWHRRVAAWVEARAGERGGEVLGLVAEHLERGGDTERAASFWVRAARAALQRDARAEALAWAARAEALDDPTARQVGTGAPSGASGGASAEQLQRAFEVAALRERVAEQLADAQARQNGLDTMARLADQLDDPALQAQTLHRLSWWRLGRGEHVAGAQAAEAAIAKATDPQTRARAHHVAFAACFYQTQLKAARTHAEAGLVQARLAQDRYAEGLLLNGLAVLDSGVHVLKAIDTLKQSVACYRASASRWALCVPMANLGMYLLESGQLAEAEPALTEALQLAEESANVATQARAHTQLARLALEQDQPAKAMVHAQAARACAEASGLSDLQSLTMEGLACVHLYEGRAAQALAAAQEATTRRRQLGEYGAAGGSAGVAIRAMLALGQREQLPGAVQELLADYAHIDGFNEPWVPWYAWQGLHAVGDPAALTYLAQAHASLMDQAEAFPEGAVRERWLHSLADRRAVLADWQRHGPVNPQPA